MLKVMETQNTQKNACLGQCYLSLPPRILRLKVEEKQKRMSPVFSGGQLYIGPGTRGVALVWHGLHRARTRHGIRRSRVRRSRVGGLGVAHLAWTFAEPVPRFLMCPDPADGS